MAREAFIELNCCRYSEKIVDVIMLFKEIGWKYYDLEGKIEYLPLGDIDDFEWQKNYLSEQEIQKIISNKQDNLEQVGINLYYQNSELGVTFLAKNTKEIIIDLCINRKLIDSTHEAITDISWYFVNIIQMLKESGCPIDYVKFEDYVD